MEEPKCLSCKKKLTLIKMDWTSRKYHKKCWKLKQELEAGDFLLYDYLMKEKMITLSNGAINSQKQEMVD